MFDLSGLYTELAGDNVPVPLLSVECSVVVKNFVAEVEVRQKYHNREENPLEVVYYFPVEESASVIGCRAQLDEKEIVAKIQEREKAEKIYEDAVKEKKTAVLLSQTRPDIFQLKLGSLSPGAECLVIVTYVTELPVEETKTRLTIPTTIAPKYVPGGQEESSVVPTVLRNILYKRDSPAPLSLTMRILMKTRITIVESPSHNLETKLEEGEVKFAGDTAALDRDIIVLITSEEPFKPKIMMEKGKDGTVAAMLSLVPRFQMKKQPSECIFLVDCSGSMRGPSIKLAREALSVFVNSLPVDCHFNVYSFGSRYNKLFPSSQPLTDHTLEAVKSLLVQLDANLGGTAIFPPLQDILAQELVVGKPRQVFVITDGQVSNTEQIVRLVTNHVTRARVFSLGIGSTADRLLVKGVARAGRATAEFVSYGEKISGAVIRQLKLGLQPCLQNVTIDWGERQEGLEHCQAPAMTPPLYDGTRMIVYKLWESEARLAESVTITANTPECKLEEQLEMSDDSSTEGDLVHKMFARKMIQDLEERLSEEENSDEIKSVVTSLALKYNLASRFTSFVGVNEKSNAGEDGYLVSTEVHNMIPQGMYRSRTITPRPSAQITMVDCGGAGDLDEEVVHCSRRAPPGAVLELTMKKKTRYRGLGQAERPVISRTETDSLHTPVKTDMEKLLSLTNLQTAAGAFQYSSHVLDSVIGAVTERFRSECKGRNIEQEKWLTALVIAFIELRFDAEKDTWDLIIEKSREWLSDDQLIEEAKILVLKN